MTLEINPEVLLITTRTVVSSLVNKQMRMEAESTQMAPTTIATPMVRHTTTRATEMLPILPQTAMSTRSNRAADGLGVSQEFREALIRGAEHLQRTLYSWQSG